VSEEFWGKVLDLARYTLGGLGLLILFMGWPKFYRKCKCDKCKNFKDE
jgi:hypothetical protein